MPLVSLVPRLFVPLDQRSKKRETLGAIISGMCIDADCSENGWAEFGYFLCYFETVVPIVSRFLTAGHGERDWCLFGEKGTNRSLPA